MGISELQPQIESIERLVNLVTIDAINTGQSYITEDADPLKKTIHFPLKAEISKEIHSRLRGMIKSLLWTGHTAGGKISFSPSTLTVGVYLKGLRSPAWRPKDS